MRPNKVATVLTACGIETCERSMLGHGVSSRSLQQCLPLAVLKLQHVGQTVFLFARLQQCLPLAVLKLTEVRRGRNDNYIVATVLTACGIET